MIALPRFEDDVIRLRPWREEDVPAVAIACNDPLIQLYTNVPRPYDEDDAHAFIVAAPGRRIAGDALDMAIGAADDDRVLGAIGLYVDRHDRERAEVGYWVAPEARGRGVVGRALAFFSRWALADGGFVRLDLRAAAENTASCRAAERCGFVREGTMRAAWYRGPQRGDMAFYSLLRSDLT